MNSRNEFGWECWGCWRQHYSLALSWPWAWKREGVKRDDVFALVGVVRVWGRARTESKTTNTPQKGQVERKNQMLVLTPQACPQLSATHTETRAQAQGQLSWGDRRGECREICAPLGRGTQGIHTANTTAMGSARLKGAKSKVAARGYFFFFLSELFYWTQLLRTGRSEWETRKP